MGVCEGGWVRVITCIRPNGCSPACVSEGRALLNSPCNLPSAPSGPCPPFCQGARGVLGLEGLQPLLWGSLGSNVLPVSHRILGVTAPSFSCLPLHRVVMYFCVLRDRNVGVSGVPPLRSVCFGLSAALASVERNPPPSLCLSPRGHAGALSCGPCLLHTLLFVHYYH